MCSFLKIFRLRMERKELTTTLQQIIQPYVQNQVAFKSLTEETDLLDDLGINSANLVDIILDVEDAFNIEIDDKSAEKMLTVGAALDIIEGKISSN